MIDSFLPIWKSDLSDEIKRKFYPAETVASTSLLLHDFYSNKKSRWIFWKKKLKLVCLRSYMVSSIPLL